MEKFDETFQRLVGVSRQEAEQWLRDNLSEIDQKTGEKLFEEALEGSSKTLVELTKDQEKSLREHRIVPVTVKQGAVVRDTFSHGGSGGYWTVDSDTNLTLQAKDVHAAFGTFTLGVDTDEKAMMRHDAMLHVPYKIVDSAQMNVI